MPLSSTSATRAMAQLQQNRLARWPDGRKDGRRLEGIVLPASVPSFRLRAGMRIFTAGSCFARNIETHLVQLGFEVPANSVSLPEDERSSNTANDILNKYNPQSIVNELIWAFEQPFPEEAYLRLDGDLWHDPHLAGNAKAAPLERVRERRAMVTQLFRQLPRCRAIIVTLGLVEAWFDTTMGIYLNGPPPAAAVAREPKRFRFDVLSHAELLAELQRMWQLVTKHGHPKLRMLVTVSPVPLRATHTDQDVLVANSYSKSVLRAAVGEFAAGNKLVDYFPSYEAATLTARPTAFMEDNRHVAPQMVSAIMDRVMSAYVREEATAEDAAPVADDALVTLGQRIRAHLRMGRLPLARRVMEGVAASGDFASAEYDEFQFRYVYSKTLVDADMLLEASMELARCVELEPGSAMAHYGLGRVLVRLQRSLRAEDSFRRAVALDPTNIDALLRLARLEARNGKLPQAEQTAMRALAVSPESAEVAEVLAELRASATGGWGQDFLAPVRALPSTVRAWRDRIGVVLRRFRAS